jgi:hypothetical protein
MSPETKLIRELLIKHHQWLTSVIQAQDNLSQPCPEGYWRWAGRSAVPGAAEKAAKYRAELEVTKEAFARLDVFDQVDDLRQALGRVSELLGASA